jgi:hypothetical protein
MSNLTSVKTKHVLGLLVGAAAGVLAACSPVRVSDYRNFQPALSPETFFDGRLTAHGVVKNRSGRVIRIFNARIDARWEEGVGTLDEQFVFDDGERQRRVWRLESDGDGSWSGTAGDVVGTGVLNAAGNSLFLDYVLRIPYEGSTIDVKVDDRMYLVSPDVLINESTLSKFGVRVGSILLTIIRHDGAAE